MTASKYNVRIIVSHTQRKLTYDGSVLSIEDLPNIEDKKASMKYWFVAYDALEPFIDDCDTVPITVKLLKIGKKRKRM